MLQSHDDFSNVYLKMDLQAISGSPHPPDRSSESKFSKYVS